MKTKQALILVVVSVILFCALTVCATDDIKLNINGKDVLLDVPPVMVNDRVLIPVRVLFETVGGNVEWFPDTQRVVIEFEDKKIILAIGRDTAFVSGEEIPLDVPAQIISDRTLIPVRFVAENLGMDVDWDQETQTVLVKNIIINSYTLSEASVSFTDDNILIKLTGVGEIKHKYIKLANPNRMIFDFENCNLSKDIKNIAVKDGNLLNIRFGQFNGTTARVVFDVNNISSYKVSAADDVLTIQVPATEITDVIENYSSKYTLSSKAKNKLVVIDPGHGGKDVGTIGVHKGKDVYEKDINIKICKYLNQYLKNSGVKTYMIRSNDETVDIYERPEIANEKGAYLYLSVHNNSSVNPETNGVQIYYSNSTVTFDGIENKTWAKFYYDEIALLGLNKAGMVDNDKYIVINKTKMPAIIVENAFVSNEDDLNRLMDDDFLKKLAQKICDATVLTLNKTV